MRWDNINTFFCRIENRKSYISEQSSWKYTQKTQKTLSIKHDSFLGNGWKGAIFGKIRWLWTGSDIAKLENIQPGENIPIWPTEQKKRKYGKEDCEGGGLVLPQPQLAHTLPLPSPSDPYCLALIFFEPPKPPTWSTCWPEENWGKKNRSVIIQQTTQSNTNVSFWIFYTNISVRKHRRIRGGSVKNHKSIDHKRIKREYKP